MAHLEVEPRLQPLLLDRPEGDAETVELRHQARRGGAGLHDSPGHGSADGSKHLLRLLVKVRQWVEGGLQLRSQPA